MSTGCSPTRRHLILKVIHSYNWEDERKPNIKECISYINFSSMSYGPFSLGTNLNTSRSKKPGKVSIGIVVAGLHTPIDL